jgi:hypothetical protein
LFLLFFLCSSVDLSCVAVGEFDEHSRQDTRVDGSARRGAQRTHGRASSLRVNTHFAEKNRGHYRCVYVTFFLAGNKRKRTLAPETLLELAQTTQLIAKIEQKQVKQTKQTISVLFSSFLGVINNNFNYSLPHILIAIGCAVQGAYQSAKAHMRRVVQIYVDRLKFVDSPLRMSLCEYRVLLSLFFLKVLFSFLINVFENCCLVVVGR